MRIVSILLAAALAAFGQSTCDIPFQLDATHLTVQFNNQTKACYNWQVTYYNTGFSALSIQFESAPTGASSNVPGTWAAFAGSLLSGSNPASTTTQATATFAGSFPFVRIRLVSQTGSGVVTGRILGAQLTAANTFFPSVFSSNGAFGVFTPPVFGDFSWVDQGSATATQTSDGFFISIPTGGNSDLSRKFCHPLPASPWTVIMAYIPFAGSNNNGSLTGIGLNQTGASTEINEFDPQNGGQYDRVSRCAAAQARAACTNIAIDSFFHNSPVKWVRVTDNGVQRVWEQGPDGKNWKGINRNGLITGADYAAVTPNSACFLIWDNNGNFQFSVKAVSFQACAGSQGTC